MKSVLLALLPAMATTIGAQGPQVPEATNVFEILPLQHLCSQPVRIGPPHWTTMLSHGSDGDFEPADLLHVGGREESQFDSGWISHLLYEWNETAIDEERLNIDDREGAIHLRGEREAVEAVRQQIRDLSAVLTRPVRIEVSIWRSKAGPTPPTTLTPAGYAELTAQHELLWQKTTMTRSAQAVSFDSSRWTDYVREVDVEIAQKSYATNPEVDSFFEGAQAVVTPHALVGDDGYVVQAQFTWAERDGPVRLVSTDIPKSSNIESPRVHSLCAGFSGRVRDGGALCATMRGDPELGSNCVFTVRVIGEKIEAPTALPCGVFPVSALTNGALLDRARVHGRDNYGGRPHGYALELDANETSSGRIDDDTLVEILRSAFTSEEEEDVRLEVAGGHLVIRGPAGSVQRAQAMLAALESSLLRNVNIRQRVQLADRLGGDGDKAAICELSLPTMPGRFVTAMRRWETNIIFDIDVEVAQSSDVTDPESGFVQCGTWLCAQVAMIDDRAHLVLDAHCTDGVLGQPRAMVPDGAIQLPSITSQRVVYEGLTTSGMPIEHGDGPRILRKGQPCRSEVVTTVRW